MSGEGNIAKNVGMMKYYDGSNGGQDVCMVAGKHTTVAHEDTVVTGLSEVFFCGCSLNDEPTHDNTMFVSCVKSATAGSIKIVGQKPTAVNDVTPVDATTFGKDVNWWAVGRL